MRPKRITIISCLFCGVSLLSACQFRAVPDKQPVDLPSVETATTSALRGQGDFRIVLYGSLDCPFTADFYDTYLAMDNEFPGSLSLEWRHLPLQTQDWARDAAESVECAGDQQAFWPAIEYLLDASKKGALANSIGDELVSSLGLDENKYKNCLDKDLFSDKIEKSRLEAEQRAFIGTPTLLIDGKIYPGALPADDYIDDQGETQVGLRSLIKAHVAQSNKD